MVLKGAELHHKIQYTDKFRGLYSPPFDTVTEDLWSIIIFYIDSRFLFTIFPHVLIYFVDISIHQFHVSIGLNAKLRSWFFG